MTSLIQSTWCRQTQTTIHAFPETFLLSISMIAMMDCADYGLQVTCMLLLIVCETTSGSSPSNMMNRHISKTSICPSWLLLTKTILSSLIFLQLHLLHQAFLQQTLTADLSGFYRWTARVCRWSPSLRHRAHSRMIYSIYHDGQRSQCIDDHSLWQGLDLNMSSLLKMLLPVCSESMLTLRYRFPSQSCSVHPYWAHHVD